MVISLPSSGIDKHGVPFLRDLTRCPFYKNLMNCIPLMENPESIRERSDERDALVDEGDPLLNDSVNETASDTSSVNVSKSADKRLLLYALPAFLLW